MIYHGTEAVERIFVHNENEYNSAHWIDVSMNMLGGTFTVTCCCDEDWIWEFYYSKTDYERIKFTIMNLIYECDDMGELLDALDDIFSEEFENILADEDEFECDGDCENCRFIED